MADFIIREMARNELDIVLGWAEQESWRPGVADADYFYPTDPHGFFIGLLGGEPIASISGIKYGDGYGFIGLYIVKPQWRGQGFGIQLWHTAMGYLQGRNIGLDGVIAQQGNYQKSGFQIAHRHVRYQGVSVHQPVPDHGIVPAGQIPFADILAYDNAFFPEPRPGFLQGWLKQQHGTALAITRQSRVSGYGVIRACHTGFRIGPLFADSPSEAQVLFNALQNTIPEHSPIFIDIPEPNADAMALVNRYAMEPIFETARMYTRQAPDIDLTRSYGVTSLELG
ncbi:MAG: GNAT family N-acetyltransferase [Methylobacter sp.]|nr:MAG: GNAT family N-acetyltransferase [Methylobacter sp.]